MKDPIYYDGILVGWRLYSDHEGMFGTRTWVGYEWIEESYQKYLNQKS